MDPARIIVTGSRDWTDQGAIERALDAILTRHPEGLVIVHGAARGADTIAATWADRRRAAGVTPEPHPADWHRHGRAAGMIRNREMAALGATGCVAFQLNGSPGTAGMIQAARAQGIPVWRPRRDQAPYVSPGCTMGGPCYRRECAACYPDLAG